MNPTRRPAPLPPTVSNSVRSSRSSSPSSLNHSTILEPIKTPPRRITANSPGQGSLQSPTTSLPNTTASPTAPTAAVHRAIKVVEPIREEYERENRHMDSAPKRRRKPIAKKIIRRIGDGLEFVCYVLCMCCVLSGGHSPATRKSKRGHYYQYDDEDFGRPGPAPRVKKMDGSNNLKRMKRCD